MTNHHAFGYLPEQLFDDFNPASQYFPQDDLLGIEWMDNIDPELRLQTQAPLSLQVSHHFQQQSQLQQPLQRFMQEPERTYFSAAPLPIQPPKYYGAPISSLPRIPTVQGRMASPSPSQGALTSTCSSALSPPAENDWPQENMFSPPIQTERTVSQFSHAHHQPDRWFEPFHTNGAHSVDPCVQLSQIQAFSDMPQEEPLYDNDEGYDEMTMKTEYVEIDNQMLKTEGHHTSYRYSSDEGLGASIKDEGSPQNSTIHVDHEGMSDADADGDVDADGDLDQDIPLPDEEPSDAEYTPKSSRTRKRTASNKAASPTSKRARISTSKGASKSSKGQAGAGGQFSCKSCDHAPFKDATALQKHTASSHTRAFICVFAFAGCTSTFASKNEWKRHTSSQHLNLSAWVCELGACRKTLPHSSSKASSGPKGAEFNRKDLFTQHLRRMHAPFSVKRMQKKNPEWEERLKELQVDCLRVKRHAPTKLRCPVDGCGSVFEGGSCWDDRMEHVGKHLEKAGRDGSEVRQERDELLVQWAVREGVVEVRPGGMGYRLVVGGRERALDEDAEGEEE